MQAASICRGSVNWDSRQGKELSWKLDVQKGKVFRTTVTLEPGEQLPRRGSERSMERKGGESPRSHAWSHTTSVSLCSFNLSIHYRIDPAGSAPSMSHSVPCTPYLGMPTTRRNPGTCMASFQDPTWKWERRTSDMD